MTSITGVSVSTPPNPAKSTPVAQPPAPKTTAYTASDGDSPAVEAAESAATKAGERANGGFFHKVV